MKIAALAGGVGGAKLAQGFQKILQPDEFSVIVNTGDDFWHWGQFICPDLDTMLYTLGGVADPVKGWGIENDTFLTLEAMKLLDQSGWFQIGDQDLAVHLIRTENIKNGVLLTEITKYLCNLFGIANQILPMTDLFVPTFVDTIEHGIIQFQEYFVRYHYKPKVNRFIFSNIEKAILTKIAVSTLEECDVVVICPSNPFVSIDPILKIGNMRKILQGKMVICVSPLIAGEAIKGPLAKIFHEFDIDPNPLNVAKHYLDFLNVIYIDTIDHEFNRSINRSGIICKETNIFLPDVEARVRLAEEILKFAEENQQ